MIKFILALATLACISVQVGSLRVSSNSFGSANYASAAYAPPADCETVTGRRCQFPFVYRGKTYYDCTYDHTDNGEPWCAYETRRDGSAVPNKWQDCDKSVCFLSEEPCVTSSGPDVGNTCKFPFKYNGQTYNSCTKYTWSGRGYGKNWCSTKTDRNGNHINGKGHYGFCGNEDTCYQQSYPHSRKICYTESGPDSGKECKFPFSYDGQTYYSCAAPYAPEDKGRYWCSTKTDRYNNHITGEGNYGYCGYGC